jgi:transcriptional regulator with GAF, ATPase, and Fis domain
VLAEVELRSLERDNLRAALQAAKGKIRGPAGAAELLGIKPTTLLARMKKWGVNRP